MAQFNGFKCDSCGNIVDHDQRTKKTVKFEGGAIEGEFYEDLCPDCVVVPHGVTLKPLRRRTKPTPVQDD